MDQNRVTVENNRLNVPFFDQRNRRRYNRRNNYRPNYNQGYNAERRTSHFNINRGLAYDTIKTEDEYNTSYTPPPHQIFNPFSVAGQGTMKASISEIDAIEPVVLVHGGAGDIPDSNVNPKIVGVKLAATVGYRTLLNSGSVLDAVEAAVVSMEKDPAFNAGRGSVLNLDGEVEMEASIQRGSDLAAGCVTLIKDFEHPISIARRVMEQTPHTMLGGDGARSFAIGQGFNPVDPTSLITQNAIEALNRMLKVGGDGGSELAQSKADGVGTVGAVAIDSLGRIAVATSTGGRTGKYVGRIGDTPQIGSGTYADDNIGGVSTTGHGESILRFCLAHTIIKSMERGFSAQDATTAALQEMTKKLKNTAGAITLSNNGEVGIHFTAKRMAWSYIKGDQLFYGINKDEFNGDKFLLDDVKKTDVEEEE